MIHSKNPPDGIIVNMKLAYSNFFPDIRMVLSIETVFPSDLLKQKELLRESGG